MTTMIERVARVLADHAGDGRDYTDVARAAIEAMRSEITVDEVRRARGQWAFRMVHTTKPVPSSEFEAGYRMGVAREGLDLMAADEAQKRRDAALAEGERG